MDEDEKEVEDGDLKMDGDISLNEEELPIFPSDDDDDPENRFH